MLDPNPFLDLGNHVFEPLQNRERREPAIQPNVMDAGTLAPFPFLPLPAV